MTGESTVTVGGVDVRILVTDDGYASAHVDESIPTLTFTTGYGDSSVTVEAKGEYEVWGETLYTTKGSIIEGELYWECGEDGYDYGFFFSDVESGSVEPTPDDDERVVTVGDEQVRVTAEGGIVEAEKVTSRREEFVEKIRGWGDDAENGLYETIVDTTGEGGDNHHACIVADTFGLFDGASDLEPEGAELTYINTVTQRHVDLYNIPEEYIGDTALFFGDPERM